MADADPLPPAGPADPFPMLTTIGEEAAWLREHYESYIDVGFTAKQALRLCRDHLYWAYYADDPEEPDG